MRGLVMKKSLITGALITGAMFGALMAGSAMAADMPVKAPIMRAPPPPVFSWTGCYIGGGGGYGMWNQETFHETAPCPVANSPTKTGGGPGWFGHVHTRSPYLLIPRLTTTV